MVIGIGLVYAFVIADSGVALGYRPPPEVVRCLMPPDYLHFAVITPVFPIFAALSDCRPGLSAPSLRH